MARASAGIFASVVMVVVMAVASSGFGSPSTSPGPTITSSAASPNGIQLNLALNSSTLTMGQRLNIMVSITNTLSNTNTVRTSNDWLFLGVPVALWPACYFGIPAQMVVLQGDYGLAQLETVANVNFNYFCMEGWNVDHVVFKEMSDVANLTGTGGIGLLTNMNTNQNIGPIRLVQNFTTGGYWNLQSLAGELNIPIIGERDVPNTPPDSTPFTPGTYTVAVTDEWGQAVVTHFIVIATEPSEGSLIYLTDGCYATGAGGYIPCFASANPYVFNCAAAAATPRGCTQVVTSTLVPYPSYIINIRYPFISASAASWSNCRWIVSGATGAVSGNGHCFSFNSTSFVVGEQAPPPP